MIHVIATIGIKEGKRSEFVAIFKENVKNVVREKGCVEYRPTIDASTDISAQGRDDNVVIIIEKWESLEDLMTHLTAPHMLSYREKVKNLVGEVSLKVLEDA